jgi:hypothetical protein
VQSGLPRVEPTPPGYDVTSAEEPGGPRCLRKAEGAVISCATLATGARRVAVENVLAMGFAQRLAPLGAVRCPGNPKERRPPIASLGLLSHACDLLPCSRRGGETPGWRAMRARPSLGGIGVSPPLLPRRPWRHSPEVTDSGKRSNCIRLSAGHERGRCANSPARTPCYRALAVVLDTATHRRLPVS